ncbi:RNA polymerase sporulation-specific sigma factor [Clostridium collagenovorans DSM 3089]|uniref:RNA polymerase sigma factor SigS n=1 Tax=Clostridium collagenovorans DSM 3089 TaxID=1121306 RepID=A0A1M5YM22_9CLOT|nr:RNA polymerase sporulation sigma factor SigH [Clostridium collagenovorans]SHI12583.1 RNA polymerase sporulation-specific sigma factor [Clostridium collagenovorans DSM 3089]
MDKGHNSGDFRKDLEIKLEKVSDEDIAIQAKNGNKDAVEYLIEKYDNFIKGKAKSYFLIGADKEDVYQEGMIGLYKAIRDYKGDKVSSFKSFADLCITRQIITAVKTSTRQKHIPLNTYVSLNRPIYDEESDKTLIDVVGGKSITNPEELLIDSEEVNNIENEIENVLSKLEMKVLSEYMNGKSYQEIACDLDRQVKSIDNALQRVKKKLEKSLVKR